MTGTVEFESQKLGIQGKRLLGLIYVLMRLIHKAVIAAEQPQPIVHPGSPVPLIQWSMLRKP